MMKEVRKIKEKIGRDLRRSEDQVSKGGSGLPIPATER
jgi:hypothetical protein